MKEFKKILIAMAVVIFLVVIYLFSDGSSKDGESKPRVALSTFALYDIAKHISGGKLELINIIPPGVNIHTYEPTPKTIAKVETSDLIVYSGAVLEPWITSYKFKSRSISVTDFIKIRELAHNEYDTHQHHDEQCAHNTSDPHYWLDVENMKKVTNILTYELIGVAPEHKVTFIQNRDRYMKILDGIDEQYKTRLQSCMLDTIIVNHNAFTYLANRYGFKVESLTGLSPETEVTPKDVVRLIEHVKESQVRTVFSENFVSNSSMQNLAQDANVRIDYLHSIGNITHQEFDNNTTYEDIMLQNLEKLSKALVCR